MQAKCFRHDVRPTSTAKGVTPGKSPGHNDEGIDEQGTESGSIPDARIVLDLVMGRERSVRFGHRQCSLRCGVYKRTAAPVDAIFNPPDNVFLRVNTCLHAWR